VSATAYSPILDAQQRTQTSQGKLAAFKYVPVFRCSLLVSSFRTRPASNCWTEVLQCDCQSDRSSTSSLSSGGTMLQHFKLAFSVFLYRFRCPPWERVPSSNSLQKTAFGNLLSPMHSTWPVQQSWAVIRNASMPDMLQICRTSVFDFFSCHLTCAKHQRQCMWNCSSFRTCRRYTTRVSDP